MLAMDQLPHAGMLLPLEQISRKFVSTDDEVSSLSVHLTILGRELDRVDGQNAKQKV